MSTRGFEVETKRKRQNWSTPRYRAGDRVQLRNGRDVVLTRVVVRDWTTDFMVGDETFTWRDIERKL